MQQEDQIGKPGWMLFVIGVVYPVVVIGFELATRMCAETFFDPLPTPLHVLLVSLVPAINALLWWQLRQETFHNLRALALLESVAIGVAAFYTIIFLPLIPLAVMAIMIYGMGLLPLAPLASLAAATILYRRFKKKYADRLSVRSAFWQGLSIAFIALLLLDIPPAATHLGIQWAASDTDAKRDRGIDLLRTIGDEEILLRYCYSGSRRVSGPLSFAAMHLGNEGRFTPTTKAREIFYRVTGEPFNQRPAPYTGGRWSMFNDFEFDRDQGGTVVGGRVKGLDLISSRIDGTIDGDDAVAYLEWVLEFRNHSSVQRETRVQIALPPAGVVSRATLWVNGEEREAAFAGRAKARQAYSQVVQASRDPLLVTTQGADRVLAQAFPIPPNGGTIKFRLGISAPLHLLNNDRAELVLPAIIDRNFTIGDDLAHSIWFEGKQPLESTLPDTESQSVNTSLYRINANLSDKDIALPRKKLFTERDANAAAVWSQYGENEPVVQKIVQLPAEPVDALLIVLDGSVTTADYSEQVIAALDQISQSGHVGLIVAGDNPIPVPLGEWSAEQKRQVTAAIRSTTYIGGQDNAPALAEAMLILEPYLNAKLLWIHGPQPVAFAHSATALAQTAERLSRLPDITLYAIHPGPNKLLDNAGWVSRTNTLPKTGTVEQDLKKFFQALTESSPHYVQVRTTGEAIEMLPKGSTHISRLWARDKVDSLMKEDNQKNLQAAIDIAASHQLVTVASGAVVLENAQQYQQSGLNPVDANTVPTIPEPRQWILALAVLALLLWFIKRNRALLTGSP